MFQKAKLEFATARNYLHSIYIVLDIISSLEMIQSKWEDCINHIQILCHFIYGI